MAADIFMILTGLYATMLQAPLEQWVWYAISTGAFIAILAALLTEYSGTVRKRNDKVYKLFSQLLNLLIVLWIIYPINWLFGGEELASLPCFGNPLSTQF